jgi:hypothetical protein
MMTDERMAAQREMEERAGKKYRYEMRINENRVIG